MLRLVGEVKLTRDFFPQSMTQLTIPWVSKGKEGSASVEQHHKAVNIIVIKYEPL